MGAKRVYLSPSNQDHNVGIGGYNEEINSHVLAAVMKPLLEAKGLQVRISNPGWTINQVCSDSKAWKPNVHICIHSDAGPAAAEGTTTLVSKLGGQSEALGKLIQAATVGVMRQGDPDHPDRGVKVRADLGELNSCARSGVPACLVERGFHTNRDDVAALTSKQAAMAAALVGAICRFLGV